MKKIELSYNLDNHMMIAQMLKGSDITDVVNLIDQIHELNVEVEVDYFCDTFQKNIFNIIFNTTEDMVATKLLMA